MNNGDDHFDQEMINDGYVIRTHWMSSSGLMNTQYSRDSLMANAFACSLIDAGRSDVSIEIYNESSMLWRSVDIVEI